MVNQVILDYLSRYSGMYKLEDLKNKIISTGYSPKEVNEAIRVLNFGEKVEKKVSEFQSFEQKPISARRFKWMKFAGIIGVIFLILGIVSSIASIILPFFYTVPSLDAGTIEKLSSSFSNPLFIIIVAILSLLFPLALIFFYTGFAKMGKLGESKLLRFSSRAFIILIILFMVLGLTSIILGIVFGDVIVKKIVDVTVSGGGLVVNPVDSNNVVLDDYSNSISGSAINIAGVNLGIAGYVLIITFLLIILFVFLNTILFFIGLIKVGKQVRFAKIAGVFGLILFLLYIGFAIVLILNPLLFIAIASSGFGTFFIGSILSSLGCLVLLFMSLALFNGSAKFESD